MPKSKNGHTQGAGTGGVLTELTALATSNPPHGTVDRALHCELDLDWLREFKTCRRRLFVSPPVLYAGGWVG